MISALFYSWLVLLILTVVDIKGHIYWTSNEQFLCKRHLDQLKNDEFAKLQEGVSCKLEIQTGSPNSCRNRNKDNERKEGLWWTLPIPPMEVEGLLENKPAIKPGLVLAEKPQTSSSREAVVSSTSSPARRSSTTSLPNSSLQRSVVSPANAGPKGEARLSSSTMKINAVTSLAELVSSSTALAAAVTSAKEKSNAKIAQIQKPQAQPACTQAQHAHIHQHHQHQSSMNAYSQCAAANKVAVNAVSTGNKAITSMKSSTSTGKAAPAKHVANKVKPCVRAGQDMMNLIDPFEASDKTFLQEYIHQRSVDHYSQPHSVDFHDQAYKSDEDLFKDNFPEKVYQANAQLRKNFNSNEAELGGGGYVGNVIFSDSRLAPQQSDLDNSWATLSADERDKRNTFDNLMYQNMFNDTVIS